MACTLLLKLMPKPQNTRRLVPRISSAPFRIDVLTNSEVAIFRAGGGMAALVGAGLQGLRGGGG